MENQEKEPIAILGVNSSSNQKIYTIAIWNDAISCNCPAGGVGGICKHVKNILNNKPEFLSDYSKDKEIMLKNKLENITKQVSSNVFEIIKEIETIKSDPNRIDKKELINQLNKQIIKISKHTVAEAFTQIKALNKTAILLTTPERLEAFNIIKSILKDTLDTNKITCTDYKNSLNLKLSRKTICKLYLNDDEKTIAFIDNGEEHHLPIDNINNLYHYSDLIIQEIKGLL